MHVFQIFSKKYLWISESLDVFYIIHVHFLALFLLNYLVFYLVFYLLLFNYFNYLECLLPFLLKQLLQIEMIFFTSHDAHDLKLPININS